MKKFKSRRGWLLHSCKCPNSGFIKGVDYIECPVCHCMGENLSIHVKQHGIDEGDWVTPRLRQAWQDHAMKISRTPSGRETRRQNMIRRNQTSESRLKSSETAKMTSARSDILLARQERLQSWRNNNREEFHAKCTAKMINTWQSRPELELGVILNSFASIKFKHNQFVKDDNFSTSSKKRQVDYISEDHRVIVEFDGIRHFKNLTSTDRLSYIRKKDREFNEWVLKNDKILVRISKDKYSYKTGFDPIAIEQVKSAIESEKSGVYLIGESYNDEYFED